MCARRRCVIEALNMVHGCVQQMICFAKEFTRQCWWEPGEEAWDAAALVGAI